VLSQQNNDTIKRYYSKQIKLKKVNSKQTARFPIRKLLILDINQSWIRLYSEWWRKSTSNHTEYWFLKVANRKTRKYKRTNRRQVHRIIHKIYQSIVYIIPVLPFFLFNNKNGIMKAWLLLLLLLFFLSDGTLYLLSKNHLVGFILAKPGIFWMIIISFQHTVVFYGKSYGLPVKT
jgi:hypothetical protein